MVYIYLCLLTDTPAARDSLCVRLDFFRRALTSNILKDQSLFILKIEVTSLGLFFGTDYKMDDLGPHTLTILYYQFSQSLHFPKTLETCGITHKIMRTCNGSIYI